MPAPAVRQGTVLLGLGTAPGYVDLALPWFFEHFSHCLVFGVNDSIGRLDDPRRGERDIWRERMDCCGSLHTGELHGWLEARRNARLPMPSRVFGYPTQNEAMTDRLFEASFSLGTSAFLPVVVGRMLLKCPVVLAGVELAGGYGRYRKVWREAAGLGLLDQVYSLTPGFLVDEGLALPASQLDLEAA